MSELSATVILRPTRIGFLCRPNDLNSVRKIMKANMCVWGGAFNPIIPVFTRAPAEWKGKPFERQKARDVAKGYARFFEPDVYVEAEAGLLEEAGLATLRPQHGIHDEVCTLNEFLKPEGGKTWSEPRFGANIMEIFRHLYETDKRFAQRNPVESLLVSPLKNSGAAEAMFGVFPSQKDLSYVRQGYRDVFRPETDACTPDVWRKVFTKGADTPLRATRHAIDVERHWHHDVVLFVFDPRRATDLIDLWNLRLEPHPILPVPVDWFGELANEIHDVLTEAHRPIVGNPQRLMHNGTIEFARSIAKDDAEALLKTLKPGLPQGALVVKHWRNRIWVEHRNDYVHRDQRMKIVAEEQNTSLTVRDDGELRTKFSTIAPPFASQYGGRDFRWANVLQLASYGSSPVALLLPFNTFDRSWPRLGSGGDRVAVGSEGWVFAQRYTGHDEYVSLFTAQGAIVGWLKTIGVTAKLSEPGHIAQQMLEHLGGLWGVGLLADCETLQLLNKMAGGTRLRRNDDQTIEEQFPLRTATLKDWTDLIARRKGKTRFGGHPLEQFVKRNIIRLGLETDCPNCKAQNWTTLSAVDYQIECERCLKPYAFPQAALRDRNRNWTYRVIGPFTAPDFGRGSYSALLALRALNSYRASGEWMTFATAMTLSFDGVEREVDLIAWKGDDKFDVRRQPRLVIGEAKSLGSGELITKDEIAKLKSVAAKLPDAVVVIAVLRDHFTKNEKKLLTKFVTWGRTPNSYGEPSNPVLLLTSTELLMEHSVTTTWKHLGGKHAQFSSFREMRNLLGFANVTQQLYLDMPSFGKWLEERWKKRLARRQKRASVQKTP